MVCFVVQRILIPVSISQGLKYKVPILLVLTETQLLSTAVI